MLAGFLVEIDTVAGLIVIGTVLKAIQQTNVQLQPKKARKAHEEAKQDNQS